MSFRFCSIGISFAANTVAVIGFVVFVFEGGRIFFFCRKEGFFFSSLHCNDGPLPYWPDFNHLVPGSQCGFVSAFAQAFL